MTDMATISPERAYEKVRDADDDTYLVCAYDDEEKCRENALAGAISLPELQRNQAGMSKDARLVFY